MNKDARSLRDNYGVPYSTALRWIRELGLDAAIAKCESEASPEAKDSHPPLPDPGMDVNTISRDRHRGNSLLVARLENWRGWVGVRRRSNPKELS